MGEKDNMMIDELARAVRDIGDALATNPELDAFATPQLARWDTRARRWVDMDRDTFEATQDDERFAA
jgi:hypothetical protein